MLRLTLVSLAALCLRLGGDAQGLQAQSGGRLIGSIGGPDGRGAVLENPEQVLVLDDRIVVVERSAPFLKVFDLDGRLRQSTGSNGAGPGEFRLIYTTAYDPSRKLLLAFDTPLGRVTRLALGDTLRFVSSHALSLQVESACFMGSRLFASARTSAGIIHELLGDGPEVRVGDGFGRPDAPHPLASNRLYQDYLVAGHLFCDTLTNSLTLATSFSGFVHVVAVGDGAQRTIALEQFNPVAFSAVGTSLTLATPANGVRDEVLSVRALGDARVLTVGRTDSTHTGGGDFASYREIVMDRVNGQRIGLASPWRLVDSARERVVCYRTEPEPVIVILRGRGCP